MGAVLSGDPNGPAKKREDSGIDFMEPTIDDMDPSDEDKNNNARRSIQNLQETPSV